MFNFYIFVILKLLKLQIMRLYTYIFRLIFITIFGFVCSVNFQSCANKKKKNTNQDTEETNDRREAGNSSNNELDPTGRNEEDNTPTVERKKTLLFFTHVDKFCNKGKTFNAKSNTSENIKMFAEDLTNYLNNLSSTSKKVTISKTMLITEKYVENVTKTCKAFVTQIRSIINEFLLDGKDITNKDLNDFESIINDIEKSAK